MKAQKFLYSDLTNKIIGLAIKVHKELGSAYEEKVYQRAMYLEFQGNKLRFEREKEIDIKYSMVTIGKKKLDFIIDNKVILELKKADAINDVHIAQVVSYLKTMNLRLGLILNFGVSKLQIKRVITENEER